MAGIIEFASTDDEGVNKQELPNKFEIERGISYSMPYGAPYEGYMQVLRREEITARQMMEMYSRDGQARALFRLITLPIRAAMKNASFVPAEGGDKEAEFITQMFTLPPNSGGMVIPFERVMAQILMALFNGFSTFEQVYWAPEVGPLKGKYTLKKLAYRPPDGVTFLVDGDGHWQGIRQLIFFANQRRDVFIPREDVFYFAAQESDRPFYGESYFKPAYFHWDKKCRLEYMMYLAGQRSAVGFRVGKYEGNPSKGEKHDFAVMLENMSFAQAAMVPKTWEIDSLKEGGNFDFLAAINYQNSQMSKSVLAEFFDDNQGTSANTTPMVDFSQRTDEFFTLMLRTIMGDIAAAINHYVIPKFIDWNFDSGLYPKYEWGSFTDEQLQAIRHTFDELAVTPAQGSQVSPEVFRAYEKKISVMDGLDVNWAAVEAREKQEKAAAEKAAQQQVQQFGGGANQQPNRPPFEAQNRAQNGPSNPPPPTNPPRIPPKQ